MALIGPGGRRAPARGGGGGDPEEDEEPDNESESSNANRRRRNFERLRESSPNVGDEPSESEESEAEAALNRGAFGEPLERTGSSTDGGPTEESNTTSSSAGTESSGGGGVLGGVENAIDAGVGGAQDVFGVDEFRQRESVRENRRAFEEAGPLGKFDVATQTGFDFFLDNPNASVQETAVDAIGAVTGAESDEEVGEQFQSVDEGTTETIDRAVAGTPLEDNLIVEGARTGGDLFIGETLRAFARAGTGIDPESGETEAEIGALDAFDIGLTATGGGKLASAALKGSDDALIAGTRGLRGTDDLFSFGGRQADEAGDTSRMADQFSLSSRADETAGSGRATSEADETLPVLRRGDEAGDATRGADEAGDAGRGADEIDGGSVVDEAAEGDRAVERLAGRARSAGQAGRRFGARAGDVGRRAGRTIGSIGARAGGGAIRGIRNVPTPSGRQALAGTGVVLGSGIALELLEDESGNQQRVEAGGVVFSLIERLEATNRFQGGLLYQVKRENEILGYTVLLGQQNGVLLMLNQNGSPTAAPLNPGQFHSEERAGSGGAEAMAVFETEQAAREAYRGGADGTEAEPTGPEWLEIEPIEELEGGWSLSRQERQSGEERRYFVVRGSGEEIEVLTSGGGVESFNAATPVGELPSFESEDAARSAHQKWLDEQEKNGEQPSAEWTEWEEIESVPPWYVYGRSAVNGESEQFVIGGVRAESRVYLAPGGKIVEEAHIYSSSEAVSRALQAYFEAVESGDVDESERPAGTRPSVEGVAEDARRQSESPDEPTGLLGLLMENPVISVSLVVLLVVLYLRSRGDLSLPEISAGSDSLAGNGGAN